MHLQSSTLAVVDPGRERGVPWNPPFTQMLAPKIGAPKPSETFQELYDRARVLEQHEQQYVESAASRGDVLRKSTSRGREGNQKGSVPPKTVPR